MGIAKKRGSGRPTRGDGESADAFRHHVYEVALRGSDFGRLVSTTGNAAVGSKCYESFYGRLKPCEGCPAATAGRTGARAHWVLSTPPEGFLLAMARVSQPGRAQVTTVVVPDELCDNFMQEKVLSRVKRAGLTKREREVFEGLTMGRSVSEIGKQLGIKPRTVKFHQDRLLSKLGADSRIDLIRILI